MICHKTIFFFSSLIFFLFFFYNKSFFLFSDYLCNVLDDLGLSAEQMGDLKMLLKAKPNEMREVAERMPQRLTHAVSRMRNIEL